VKLLGAARDLPQARAALGEPANALEAHPDIGIEKVVAAEAIKGHGARTPLTLSRSNVSLCDSFHALN
jgi:hypothetical protein